MRPDVETTAGRKALRTPCAASPARYLSIFSSARCSQDKNKKRAGRTCDGVVFHWCKELFYNTRVAEEKILLLKVHFARDAFSQKVKSRGLLLKNDWFHSVI